MPGTDEFDSNVEELRRQFWGDDASAKTDMGPKGNGADSDGWSEPDMGVLRLRRRPPPALPLEVFGETWKHWLLDAAVAAACPVDYVVAPLLASVSTLIGNARWAQAWPGKGVVMVRDEIAGWLMGMEAYNPAGRAFWLEAYGGRPYRVERRKHGAEPIEIERLAVAVYGGTQPERLSLLATGPDDGLFSRILWMWPNPVPFRRGAATPNVDWAIEAFDRLRELDLGPGNPPSPILMSLTPDAQRLMDEFGAEMEARLDQAGGLLRSAFGKARGAALRLSLVLEWLWCCAKADMSLPPDSISKEAFAAAATLVGEYFMPMAERVFGDAGATDVERDAATLTRWILKEQPDEVHVRTLLREVRLPGLRTAEQIKRAADLLIEADWLRAPAKTVFGQPRSRVAYPVNPRLWGR